MLEMRHFDVQFVGGMTLHQGKISEMRTGEGKTLVATLPSYLNALTVVAYTWSRSTTIWQDATQLGWGKSTSSWACAQALYARYDPC